MSETVWDLLLVEDDAADYRLVLGRLERLRPGGFRLTWAAGVDQALEALDTGRPAFDAALIDHDLGGRSGLELAAEIRRRGHAFPLILLTGSGGSETAVEDVPGLVAELLVKDEMTPRSLERAIRYTLLRHKDLLALQAANRDLTESRDLLERRVVQRTEELRLQNLKLKAILDNAPVALWALDRQGRLVASEGRGLPGVQPQDVQPRQPSAAGLAALHPDITPYIRRALDGEEFVALFHSPPPEDRAYEIHFTPQTGPQGEINGVTGLQIDVTERLAAEARAQVDKRRTEFLAKLSHDLAAASRDRTSTIDIVNRLVVDQLGDICTITMLSEDRCWLETLSVHALDPEAQRLQEQIFAGHPYPVGEGIAGKVAQSGVPLRIDRVEPQQVARSTRPEYAEFLERYPVYSLLIVPLQAHGRVIGTLGVVRLSPDRPYTAENEAFLVEVAERTALALENADLFQRAQVELDERRRVEDALRQSQALFEQLFESAPDPILLLDPQGKIRQANHQALRVFGYSPQELEGLGLAGLIAEGDRPVVEQRLGLLPADGAPSRLEHDITGLRRSGEEFPLEPVWAPVRLEGLSGFICILHDITLRKRIATELSEVQRRLFEEVEAERARLAKALHDGPIQELYGVTFTLRSTSAELDDDDFELMLHIEQSLKQIYETIQTMRDISRMLRPPTLSPFGLEKTIRSHVDHFREQHPALDVQLELQPDSNQIPDALRLVLYRIFQNALSNVVRHAGASRVVVRLKLDAGTVTLEVEDDGGGFDFDGRYLDLVRGGHMGLAGSNERAESVGGRLEVDSAPGRGTRLRVVAPINHETRPISGETDES